MRASDLGREGHGRAHVRQGSVSKSDTERSNGRDPNDGSGAAVSRRQFLGLAGGVGVALMVGGASGLVAGCSSPDATAGSSTSTASTGSVGTPAPKYGGILRIAGTAIEPNIGWPAAMMGGIASDVQYMLETLLRGNDKGAIEPWLAEQYKVADDLGSITFTIRKGVKFSDGSDLNAEVVKWNLDNYIAAKRQPTWKAAVVLDDYTVRVDLTAWDITALGSFADMNSTNVAFIVSRAAFEQKSQEWMQSNPVGTGPFKFKSFSLGSSLLMVKNEDYWAKGDQGRRQPYLDEIQRLVVADEFTQKATMQRGEADMVRVEVGGTTKQMADLGLNINYVLDASYYLIGDTAHKQSAWANRTVREAVEYALDKEKLASAFGYGYLQAPYQVAPRYTSLYDKNAVATRGHDVAKAEESLAKAGYPNGFKTQIICFPTASKDVALAVQDQLKQVGIEAELTFTDIGKWVSLTGPGTWPSGAALFAVVPAGDVSFVGGLQYVDTQVGQGWERTAAWKSAYSSAMGARTEDPALLKAVVKVVEDDVSLIPVIESGTSVATQKYVVKDFNKRGSIPFWNSEAAWINK